MRMVQPPCQGACPIHQDVRGYLAAIARGDFDQALRIIRETNPLPFVCGTICAHPCETECRRGQVDQPLSIRVLKRFAVERGRDLLPTPVETRRDQKVAIIGSGPGGLTAAYDLTLKGYKVTIFEREGALGGALQLVIPLYRLPREVLQKDIDAILSLGVEVKTGMELGKDFSLDDLEQQGYKAVLLGLGLPLSRGLRIPGVEARDILLALPFLKAVNRGERPLEPGREVIVVGGGNVAMDVARSARRLGAKKVRLVCLETREEMPAFPWEIEEAMEEGIEIHYCGWGPKRILEQEGKVAGLECMRCLAVFDAQGRFNPSFCEEETTVLEGDTVILAIGQAADISFLKDMGVSLNERGQLLFDPETLATSRAGVFACGEMTTGPGTAVQSMASGRKAAQSIARYLEGEPLVVPQPQLEVLGELLSSIKENIKRQERQKTPMLAVEQRVSNFHQIELGYTEELAIREARRCLSCGAGAEWLEEKCSFCLTCVRVCPYQVPVVTTWGSINIRIEQCQSCGICLSECPAKAIAFRMPEVENIIARLEQTLKGLSGDKGEPVVLGLYCNYGVYEPTHFLEQVRVNHPNVGLVALPCLSKVEVNHLLKAFELGADGVLVAGCSERDCIYRDSIPWARRRVEAARKLLKEAGWEEERLTMYELLPLPSDKFDQALTEFLSRLKALT
jgi:NADPH-dependent glutamate synthase beta subunit-like oxidoreductase/coenzyme F420-reducing hydrogenase delta subunit